MAAKVHGTCTVCHRSYANPGRHFASDSHRRAVNRQANRRMNAGNPSGKLTRRQKLDLAWKKGRRVAFDMRGVERIKPHRRSRPNDGTQRVVKVSRYYRRRPDVYVVYEHAGDQWYRVRYDTASGKARTAIYASARDQRRLKGRRGPVLASEL